MAVEININTIIGETTKLPSASIVERRIVKVGIAVKSVLYLNQYLKQYCLAAMELFR